MSDANKLIHFAHPNREGSLCYGVGDVRWMGISLPKPVCCPKCWDTRKKMMSTTRALHKFSLKKAMEKERRIEEKKGEARSKKRKQRQLRLL